MYLRVPSWLIGLALCSAVNAEIVDRIAVIVGRAAIKQSDIDKEIRLTALLNGEKPDFSSAERKRACSRLIDQAIIRKEIIAGRYPEADEAAVQQIFRQIRQRYPSDAAFRQALHRDGITQDELMEHLRWQQTVLQFIAVRFGTEGGGADGNQQFFRWLDETRQETRIVFREENLK